MSFLIARYITFRFLEIIGFLLVFLLALISLFEALELIRKASKFGGLPFDIILSMTLLKLPQTIQEVIPFAMLFATVLTFWGMARRSELIIIRNAGLSAWQFIFPVSCAAFGLGVFFLVVVNPISAVMSTKLEALEARHFLRQQKLVRISESGLWLKQTIPSTKPESGQTAGHRIFHAEKIDLDSWALDRVTIIDLDESHIFQGRIDAMSAVLDNGSWQFTTASFHDKNLGRKTLTDFSLQTDLTRQDIIDSFSDPKTISFWSLPGYIRLMEETGIATRPMRMHFFVLLTQPFFYAAIILLGASFCLQSARLQNVRLLMIWSLISSILLFFVANFLKALGSAEQLPVLIAAWAPALLTMLAAINILIQTEDG